MPQPRYRSPRDVRRTPVVVGALLLVILIAGVVALHLQSRSPGVRQALNEGRSGCANAAADFRSHASGAWLTVSATVVRLLSDETGTYTHQRFIVRCPDGQTLLIVNDVGIGTRVPVPVGAAVTVRGQYIWNEQGGLIHFTHHDPQGGQGGWILYRGRFYSLEPAGGGMA